MYVCNMYISNHHIPLVIIKKPAEVPNIPYMPYHNHGVWEVFEPGKGLLTREVAGHWPLLPGLLLRLRLLAI